MQTITPPNDFHAGTDIVEFRKMLIEKTKNYPQEKFCLDLSEVRFMDSFTFRIVFDFLPVFSKVIPPKCQHVISTYNMWLDGKKGLSKGLNL